MKAGLETGKLFGIKRAVHRTKGTEARTDGVTILLNDEVMERARVEAEHRKAEAITILRRHALIC